MVTTVWLLCVAGAATLESATTKQILKDFLRVRPLYRYEQALQFGDSVVPTLLEMLHNPEDINNREAVIEMLGIVGDDRAVQPLIDIVHHDIGVREKVSANRALGELAGKGHNRALDFLIERARHDRIAWYALGVSAQPRAIEFLKMKAKSQDEGEKLDASDALEIATRIQRVGRLRYYTKYFGVPEHLLLPLFPTWVWIMIALLGVAVIGSCWILIVKIKKRTRKKAGGGSS